MMKVATILPQTYLNVIEDDDYLMALAHLIDKPGMEQYTEFFKRKAKQENTFIIMDNGLIEGDPRPISELLNKAIDIGADELILPDVFRNSKATLYAVEEATMYLAAHYTEFGEMGFMAVPQGETLEQWLSCAVLLLENPAVSCLGVPKVLVDIVGRDGRYIAIKQLMDRVGDLGGRDLHLLGCWRTPLEVSIIAKAIEQGDLPEIRGVDSAIAYVAARSNLKLNAGDRPDSHPIDFADGKIENLTMLAYNCLLWRDCVDMSKDKSFFFI
jgi:hypothetical protein